MFDKTDPNSFKHVDDWMEEVNRFGHESAVKMLVGNKADLENAVSAEEAEAKAKSFGIDYVETSAKSAYQVDLAFMTVARLLVQKRKEHGIPPIPRMPKLVLASDEKVNKDGGPCC